MPSKSQHPFWISQTPSFVCPWLHLKEWKRKSCPSGPAMPSVATLWLSIAGSPTFPEASAQQSPWWKTRPQTQDVEWDPTHCLLGRHTERTEEARAYHRGPPVFVAAFVGVWSTCIEEGIQRQRIFKVTDTGKKLFVKCSTSPLCDWTMGQQTLKSIRGLENSIC